MTEDEERKPWEKQEGESDKAFAAFALYRDAGPERSITKVAQELTKSRALVARWSKLYDWPTRASAYDRYLDGQKQLAMTKDVADMAKRHAMIAMLFQQKLLDRLQAVDPLTLSPRDIALWLDISVKVERLAREQPMDRKVLQGGGKKAPIMVTTMAVEVPPEVLEDLGDLDEWGMTDAVVRADKVEHGDVEE